MAYTPPIDEKQLVEDLQNPKTACTAFDTMMRAYGEPVYWQIRKMVASHEDANDLLQNCFMKAWSNLQNFRGDAKLSTWLYKIAVNETLNFLNKERQRNGVKEEGDDSFLLANIESDEYFDGDRLQADFQKAIATLPEKQRLVFNMRNSCNSPATPGKDTGDTFSNCFYDFLHIPSNLFSAAMFLVVKKIVS